MRMGRRGFLGGTGLATLGAGGILANPAPRAAARAGQRGIAMTIGLNRVSRVHIPAALRFADASTTPTTSPTWPAARASSVYQLCSTTRLPPKR